MQTVAYLLLALAVIGALVYALYQVNARQKRLMAELTRLERLTAEVSMNAEAVLDEVDQRIERLNQLAAAIEERAARAPAFGTALEAALGREAGPSPEPEPKPKPERKRKAGRRSRPESEPYHEAQPQPEPVAASPQGTQVSTATPGPADRYGELRAAVWALADQGQEPVDIAQALGVPRGEVLLLLNLRGKKGQPG